MKTEFTQVSQSENIELLTIGSFNYIVSKNEQIKEGDYFIWLVTNEIFKVSHLKGFYFYFTNGKCLQDYQINEYSAKIIFTNDETIIKN